MQMDAGLDTGAMLLSEAVTLLPDTTTASLHDQLAALGGRLVVAALQALGGAGLPAQPQPSEGITYAHKIDKAEAPIDWQLPAAVIERRIRAFDPFPGASTTLGGETLKLWRAQVRPHSGEPGTVLAADAGGLLVACGTGALCVTELQRPGGKRQGVQAFLQAHPVAVGSRL